MDINQNTEKSSSDPFMRLGNFRSINWLKVFISVIGLFIFAVVSFYAGHKFPVIIDESKVSKSNVVNVPNSQVVSVDSNYNKYTNYTMGFSLTYPKITQNESVSCQQIGPSDYQGVQGDNSLGVIEDLQNNTVYIAPDMTIVGNGRELSSGGCQGLSSCSVRAVTLNDLTVGIPNPDYKVCGGQSNTTVENHMYMYTKVTSDADLLALAQKAYGKGCKIGAKTPDKNYTNALDVAITGDNVSPGTFVDPAKSTCPLDTADNQYNLLYSTSSAVALTWVSAPEGWYVNQQWIWEKIAFLK